MMKKQMISLLLAASFLTAASIPACAVTTDSDADTNNTVTLPFVSADPLPFTDISSQDWFYTTVSKVYHRGWITGVSDTSFAPQSLTTRATLVTALWKIQNQPQTDAKLPFTDVFSSNTEAYTAIAWAYSEGIVSGTSATTFSPDASVTREQTAALLYRFAQYRGIDVSVREDTNILSFSDAQDISEYAIPAIQWACGTSMMNGMGDGTLNPKGTTTRAQMASLLARFAL